MELENKLMGMTLSVSYLDTIVESLERILKGLCFIKRLHEYKGSENKEDDIDSIKYIENLETELKWQSKPLSRFRDSLYEKIVLVKSGRRELTEKEIQDDKLKIDSLMNEIREIIFQDIVNKVIQKENKNEEIKKSKDKLLCEIYIIRSKIFGLKQYIDIQG